MGPEEIREEEGAREEIQDPEPHHLTGGLDDVAALGESPDERVLQPEEGEVACAHDEAAASARRGARGASSGADGGVAEEPPTMQRDEGERRMLGKGAFGLHDVEERNSAHSEVAPLVRALDQCAHEAEDDDGINQEERREGLEEWESGADEDQEDEKWRVDEPLDVAHILSSRSHEFIYLFR